MSREGIKSIAESIYKHSKLVILGTVMFILGIMFAFGGNKSGIKADASTRNQKYFTCITIEYGSTLTDIAHEYMTEEYHSVNEYINEVMKINKLKNDNITSGATLVVPYYADPIEN